MVIIDGIILDWLYANCLVCYLIGCRPCYAGPPTEALPNSRAGYPDVLNRLEECLKHIKHTSGQSQLFKDLETPDLHEDIDTSILHPDFLQLFNNDTMVKKRRQLQDRQVIAKTFIVECDKHITQQSVE